MRQANTVEGRALGLMKDELGRINKLFEDAAVDAAENYQSSTEKGAKQQTGDDSARRQAKTTEDYSAYDKQITLDDVKNIHSISQQHGQLSVKRFTSEQLKLAQKWAYKFYQDLGVKSPFFTAWFGEWRAHDKTPVTVVDIPTVATEKQRSPEGVICKDTEKDGKAWKITISEHGEGNTRAHSGKEKKSVKGLTNIKGLIENAVLLNTEVHEHHKNSPKIDRVAFNHKLYALGCDEKGNVALYRITVEETYLDWKHTNARRFHNLKYVEKVAEIPTKKVARELEGRQDFEESRAVSLSENSATTYSIAELYSFVKVYDKEFTAAHDVSEAVRPTRAT